MAEEKRTENSELKRLTLNSLLPLEDLWSAKITVMAQGIAAIWGLRDNRMVLRSVACLGWPVEGKPYVEVNAMVWANLRNVSDRLKVASALFSETPQGLFYAKWPPISGLGYPVAPDPVAGVVVRVPKNEFVRAERPSKQKQGAN